MKGEVEFNNQSPMNVINDLPSITTLLQNKAVIGLESVKELLIMMGMDEQQAQIITYNDSE
jgi:hypothetical protein